MTALTPPPEIMGSAYEWPTEEREQRKQARWEWTISMLERGALRGDIGEALGLGRNAVNNRYFRPEGAAPISRLLRSRMGPPSSSEGVVTHRNINVSTLSPDPDTDTRRMRALWATVLLDAAREWQLRLRRSENIRDAASRDAAVIEILTEAEEYLRSKDAAIVMDLAGILPGIPIPEAMVNRIMNAIKDTALTFGVSEIHRMAEGDRA